MKTGLAAEAVAAGKVVELLHLTRPSGETIFKLDMKPLSKIVGYPFIGITRYALQSVLLRHLGDGDIELGARLQGLETHESEGVTELRFEGQTDVVRARAVIGADGRRCVVASKVRALALKQYERMVAIFSGASGWVVYISQESNARFDVD